jgi:ATP-dependent protease ClpP protease subunit
MAKKYDIDIDGYIGSWYSSKRFVKNALSGSKDKKVLCRVNSLGGNLDDAIDIAAQFESHGDVTCELFSLNASAATVFTLGAKKVRAHANSTYLIHKVLSWVDAWGYMNEDDIDAAIERLKAEKDRNSTQTLVIAKMYAKKSGKPVKDILNLMKQEKWLTAEQAKEWGFIDEIFEDSAIKPADVRDPDVTSLLNAAGLPVPDFYGNNPEEEDNKTGTVQAIIAGLADHLRDIFNPQNKIIPEMNKTFISVNTLLNVEGIEFKNGKVELTEDQVKILNDAIVNADAGKKTAEDKVVEKDAEIKTLNDQVEALNKKPAEESNPVVKKTDETKPEEKDEVDIDSLKNLFNALPD